MSRRRAPEARPTTGPLPAPGRPLARLLAVGGLALLLAGCTAPPPGPDGSGTPTPAGSATTTATPAGGASTTPVVDAPTAPSGGSEGSTSTPAPPLPTCAPEAVDVVLRGTDSGAGSIDYTILLTNTGSRPCTVSGAPTARMLTAEDEQLGAAATGSGAAGPTVRLAPGAGAVTVVRVVAVGEDGGPLAGRCTPQRAVALVVDSDVYGRYDRLDGDFRGCAEPGVPSMTVSPFRAA